MVSPIQLLSAALLLAPAARAHFTLSHPLPLLSLPSSQDSAPCGGIAPSFQKATSYYVGGEAIALVSTHPQVNILIRATLDPDAAGNWTNLFPVVAQSGIGSFCEPLVPVPAAWVGKKGIVQVIQSGVDGLLYQCAAVSFHGEMAASVTTLCSNSTGVTGAFASDPKLPSDGTGFENSGPGSKTEAGTDGTAVTSSGPVAATTTSVGASLALKAAVVAALGASILSAALLS